MYGLCSEELVKDSKTRAVCPPLFLFFVFEIVSLSAVDNVIPRSLYVYT